MNYVDQSNGSRFKVIITRHHFPSEGMCGQYASVYHWIRKYNHENTFVLQLEKV